MKVAAKIDLIGFYILRTEKRPVAKSNWARVLLNSTVFFSKGFKSFAKVV